VQDIKEPQYLDTSVTIEITKITLPEYKILSNIIKTDGPDFCSRALPKDFCNYSLMSVKNYDFAPGFKIARAFELTFSNGN
jgi:hypothetical protein